jgi:hypothetical protein
MPANTEEYKNDPFVLSIIDIRTDFLKLKDLIHQGNVRHSVKVPSRKELISLKTVFTKWKDDATRVVKAKAKKADKASGKTSGSKLRVVKIDKALSQFLRLKERGLPEDKYPDTLVTSNFTDWVVRSGLQNGKEVRLFNNNVPVNAASSEFLQLFGKDLRELGSGPTIKIGQINPNTGLVSQCEVLTAVLDENGVQINPFNMNKHMFIFSSHYPQVTKNVNGTYTKGRDVISKDDHPDVYAKMQEEHTLLTSTLGNARKAYKEAQETVKKLQDKKDKAIQVGDRTISDSIEMAQNRYRECKSLYVSILNKNNIPHMIPSY